MNEMTKTLVYAGAAVLLLCGAWFTRPGTLGDATADDVGKPFFPEFTNPLDAASLEIIDFDEKSATIKPFKVAKVNGVWSIPSHEGYPADAQRQLGEAAAAVIGLKKLTLASTNPALHADYGVVEPDPAKLTVGTTGVGKRVTIADKSGSKLAEFIFGKADEGKPELRYVRVPGDDRVFTAKVPTDKLSTKFEDWIEADLLKLNAWDVKQVVINDHSVDVLQGALNRRSEIAIDQDKEGKWTLADMKVFNGPESKQVKLAEDEELDAQKLNDLKNALDDLKIVDVARKPAGLSKDLRGGEEAIKNQKAAEQLSRRGFFFAKLPDRELELFSNEGEVRCGMNNGVEYLLRFGAIAGRGDAEEEKKTPDEKSKGGDAKKGDAAKPVGENRYILVTTRFNEDLIPKPEYKPLPGEPAKEAAPPAKDAAAPAKDQAAPAKSTPAPAKDAAPPAKSAAPGKDKAPPAKDATKQPAKPAGAPNGGGSDGDGAASAADKPTKSAGVKSGPPVMTVSQKTAPGKNETKGAAASKDQPATKATSGDAKSGDAKSSAPTKAGDAKAPDTKSVDTKAPAAGQEKKPDAPAPEAGKSGAEKPPAAPVIDIEQERKQIEADNKHMKEDYDAKVKEGQKKVEELNERFANWYYVISDTTYQKIHLGRDAIVKKKTKPEGQGDAPADFDALKNALPKPAKK